MKKMTLLLGILALMVPMISRAGAYSVHMRNGEVTLYGEQVRLDAYQERIQNGEWKWKFDADGVHYDLKDIGTEDLFRVALKKGGRDPFAGYTLHGFVVREGEREETYTFFFSRKADASARQQGYQKSNSSELLRGILENAFGKK